MMNQDEYVSPGELHERALRRESKLKEIQKRIGKRNRDDIAKILEMPEGRRFFHRLLEETRVFHSTFSDNVNIMSFNEGKRDIGLLFLTEVMNAKGSALMQMQNEFKSEQESFKKEIENG